MAQGFGDQSFEFLTGLEANNTRDWFNDHKATFKSTLEAPFVALLEALTNRLDGTAAPLTGGKSTLFRLNRDVRFSEDKSPYKTAVSGVLTPTGTKMMTSGVMYLHLDSTGGFLAIGFYGLSPKQLGPIRQAILDRDDAFAALLNHLHAKGRDLDRDMSLTSMPKGFAEFAEHRHAAYLKLKSFIVKDSLTPNDWISGDVIDRAQALALDCAPLLRFQKPGV
jgi:uncharacterized protein (TIGR02453 family)